MKTYKCTCICDNINYAWGGYSSTVDYKRKKFKQDTEVMSFSNMHNVFFLSFLGC